MQYAPAEQPPWITGVQPVDLTLDDLAVDETLTTLQRVERYVNSPIPLQRLVHVKLISSSARAVELDVALTVLLPLLAGLVADEKVVIRQHLPGQIEDMASVFVAGSGEEGYSAFLEGLLPPLQGLLFDGNPEVRQAASESLVKVAALVRPADLGQHVLSGLLRLAHDDENEGLRTTAAWLLGELAPVLGVELSHQFLVPEIVSLAEDPELRVRRHVAWSMRRIFIFLEGPERLLGAFLGLAQDESYRVRRAVAETMPELGRALSPEARGGAMLRAFTRLIQDTNVHVRTGGLLQLGAFIAILRGAQVSTQLVQSFASMAEDPALSEQCAFHFPGVVLTVGSSRWFEVREAFRVLSRSARPRVRQIAGASLHEVARIVGAEAAESDLVQIFEALASDKDESVRGALQFGAFLGEVPPSFPWRKTGLSLFAQLPTRAPKNAWRSRESVAAQLGAVAACFEAADVHNSVVPMATALLQDTTAQVRLRAVESTPSIVKALSSDPALSGQFLEGLEAFSKSARSQERTLFVHIAGALVESGVSVATSGEGVTFLESLVPLASDPVPGVRLAVGQRFGTFSSEVRSTETAHKLLEQLARDDFTRRAIPSLFISQE